MIHKPSTEKGYYGADVSGPVFKRIAQKIFTDAPLLAEINKINEEDALVADDYENYYENAQKEFPEVPNVLGMAGMDAVSLLENIGLKVKIIGNGEVSKQSIVSGKRVTKGEQIILNLS